MAEGITTDNYPPEAYQRYARDQRDLDTSFTTDSQFTPRRTEISVGTPYIPTGEEERFSVGQTTIWATFETLSNPLASPIFTYLLAPSLGTSEKLQNLLDRFTALKDKDKDKNKDEGKDKDEENEKDAISLDPHLQQSYQTLSTFLKLLVSLSRTFDLINAERNRYHRG